HSGNVVIYPLRAGVLLHTLALTPLLCLPRRARRPPPPCPPSSLAALPPPRPPPSAAPTSLPPPPRPPPSLPRRARRTPSPARRRLGPAAPRHRLPGHVAPPLVHDTGGPASSTRAAPPPHRASPPPPQRGRHPTPAASPRPPPTPARLGSTSSATPNSGPAQVQLGAPDASLPRPNGQPPEVKLHVKMYGNDEYNIPRLRYNLFLLEDEDGEGTSEVGGALGPSHHQAVQQLHYLPYADPHASGYYIEAPVSSSDDSMHIPDTGSTEVPETPSNEGDTEIISASSSPARNEAISSCPF
ncbi:hypothetical protein EJB05_28579, partial [Eragrostis curvula]